MKNSAWGALALVVATLGCTTGPSVPPSLIVSVYDSDGRPATADLVYWWNPAEGSMDGEVIAFPPLVYGTCVDATCTRWTWTELPVGDFEVRATESTIDRKRAGCLFFRSGSSKATRDPDQTLIIAIHLNPGQLNCEG